MNKYIGLALAGRVYRDANFFPSCANSWHLGVVRQFLDDFIQIFFIFTLMIGADFTCFTNLFGANFPVAKIALELTCTLFSCLNSVEL